MNNQPSTYLIDYEIFDSDDMSIKKGQIKVKNKWMEFEAKAALEKYLKKKIPYFHRVMIHKCQKVTNTFLGDITGFDEFMKGFGAK